MYKYFYVKRNPKGNRIYNPEVIDVREKDLQQIRTNHPEWEILGPVDSNVTVDDAPKSNTQQCPICGKSFKNLGVHKKTHL